MKEGEGSLYTTKDIIKNKLIKTMDCDFKKAFIPKGWACVNIERFSDELAEEIDKRID